MSFCRHRELASHSFAGRHGVSALHLASCCQRLGVIEYLLSLPSIDMNPLDRFGHTPYDGTHHPVLALTREAVVSPYRLSKRHSASLASISALGGFSPVCGFSIMFVLDAVREGQEAIASVLRAHGGLPGSAPALAHAVQVHEQRPHEVATCKALRREHQVGTV